MSNSVGARRVINGVFHLSGIIAAFCVFLIFALMLLGAVGRSLNFHMGSINDIVAWLCAAAAFFAMADTFKNGDFVRVTLILDSLAPTLRRTLEIVSLSIAAVAIAYLSWWATVYTCESYEFNDMATGMVALPLWIPQSTFVIGSWMLLAAVIDELFIVLSGKKPTYQTAVEERHAKGDFSGDI